MVQLHKKFEDHQVKELICCYLAGKIERSYIEEILGIKRRRFCQLVKEYRNDPDSFSIEYKRKGATRKISKDIEYNIIKELEIEEQKLLKSMEHNKLLLEQVKGEKSELQTLLSEIKKRIAKVQLKILP